MRSSLSFGPSAQDAILTILADGPSYGYEIIRHLENGHTGVRLNTVYRWLSDMENRDFVESEICPGSIGPDRRVYRLSSRGRRRVRKLFRDAVSLVMQLYDDYRYHSMGGLMVMLDDSDARSIGGRILFAGLPRLIDRDLELAHFLASRSENGCIRTVGDSTVLAVSEIEHLTHDGTICDIAAPPRYFQEVWICGVPRMVDLNQALEESRRVLKDDGTLRIISYRVCFQEPSEHRLDDFLVMSAIHQFPSLGIVNAESLCSDMEQTFGNCTAREIFQGVGLFRADKRKRIEPSRQHTDMSAKERSADTNDEE